MRISAVVAFKCLFIGHSFFVPVTQQIPDILLTMNVSHTQNDVFRGGSSGLPSSLWNSNEAGNAIKARLDGGDVDLLGMPIDQIDESHGSTAYYELWFDYALSKNPNTKFMIGLPCPDFPARHDTLTYVSSYRESLSRWPEIEAELRNKYPNVSVITNPYGLGVMELLLLFEKGRVPDISSSTGHRDTSIFRDTKGHDGTLTLTFLALFFINRIYDIDLRTANVDLGYEFDLLTVAQIILDEYDMGNLCGNTSCYVVPPPPQIPSPSLPMPHILAPPPQIFPPSSPKPSVITVHVSKRSIRRWYQSSNCCDDDDCVASVRFHHSNESIELVMPVEQE